MYSNPEEVVCGSARPGVVRFVKARRIDPKDVEARRDEKIERDIR